MKKMLSIIAIFFGVYLAALVLVYTFQRSFLYFPPQQYIGAEALGIDNVTEVLIETEEADLTAWWLPPRNVNAPVVMFFHGNASAVWTNNDIFSELNARGYGVLSVGYPGYPPNAGQATQDGLRRAAIAHYDWLIKKNIAPDHIVFYGTSLGSGVATQLALHREPSLLILEAPFTSAVELGQENMPFFPVGALMKDRFESEKALRSLDMPLLVLHGTEDEVIPVYMGEAIYESYINGPKQLHIIPGGFHTNLWELGGRDVIYDALDGGVSGGT